MAANSLSIIFSRCGVRSSPIGVEGSDKLETRNRTACAWRAALMAARRKAANGKQLTRLETWAVKTQAGIGHNKATVALANKMARIMWAVWTRHETFNGDDALRFAA